MMALNNTEKQTPEISHSGKKEGTFLSPNSKFSSASLSSVDAPSDEERYLKQVIYAQDKRSEGEIREAPSFKAFERQCNHRPPIDRRLSMDSYMPYSQGQLDNLRSITNCATAFSHSNSSVCRFRYEGVSNNVKMEDKHHHRAGTLHATKRFHNLDLNDSDASNNQPYDRPPLEKKQSNRSFFGTRIISLKIKRDMLGLNSRMALLLVACVMFVTL